MYFRSREWGGASTSYFRSTACTLLELLGPNDGGFCALATCPALLLPVIAVRSLLWVFGAGCSVCQLASGQSILNFHVYVSDTGSKSDNIFSTKKNIVLDIDILRNVDIVENIDQAVLWKSWSNLEGFLKIIKHVHPETLPIHCIAKLDLKGASATRNR